MTRVIQGITVLPAFTPQPQSITLFARQQSNIHGKRQKDAADAECQMKVVALMECVSDNCCSVLMAPPYALRRSLTDVEYIRRVTVIW